MKSGPVLRRLLLVAASVCTMSAQAATMWDEAADGDLSNTASLPTALAMTLGSNRVTGTTGNGAAGFDPDYFSFTVPANAALTSIMLLDNTFVSGSSSFIGINDGIGISASDILGFAHYSADQIGTNILSAMGLTGPLASGVYTVWVQETGGTVDYGFDFITTAVPEPSEWLLLLVGLLVTLAYSWWQAPRRHAPL